LGPEKGRALATAVVNYFCLLPEVTLAVTKWDQRNNCFCLTEIFENVHFVCLHSLSLTAFTSKYFVVSFCHRLGVDVMITIFCDFCHFSAKKWPFSQKPML
jgi:hypothetical protein